MLIKLLTLVAFVSINTVPFHSYAQEAVSEFEKSAKSVEEKVAAEQAAKAEKEQIKALRNQIRENRILLSARVEELETLADVLPNVREDVIDNTAKSLTTVSDKEDNSELFALSAVVAVASGVTYALTQFDMPRAYAQLKATKEPVIAPANVKVKKSSPVVKGLRSVYGNKAVARGSAITGVLAAIVAGVAYVDDHTLSLEDYNDIESLENNYLSLLVSGGASAHLEDDAIEDVLVKKYEEDPAFREAVLTEVRTIVSETDRLSRENAAKKQEVAELQKN